jgi:WD40 repeat protein
MPPTIDFTKATQAWALPWDADWVTAVCFLGGTRRIAAGNNLGEILLWDLPEKTGSQVPAPMRKLEGHTNVVTRLLSSPDGRWLISSSFDHTIRYWDIQAAAKGSATVALNATTRKDLIQRRSSKVPALVEAKVPTQESARTLTEHREWVTAMALSTDGETLSSGDDAGQVILWDRAAAKEVRRWQVKGWCYALALSPDKKQAAVSERLPLIFDSGRFESVKLWNAITGKMERDVTAAAPKMQISAVAYSPDGKLLALARGGEASGLSGKVYLVDPASGKKVRELGPGHLDGATDLAFHPDGKHLASAGRDTTVRVWNIADGKLVKELGKPRGGQSKDWICAISFSPDGRWLAAADMAGAVQVWSLAGPT